MLQSIYNKSSGIFVKLLMGLLVASFALWGIGDIFRTTPASTVVRVGDSVITAQELKLGLDAEVQNYRATLGRQYSPELLKTLGVPNQVLEALVQQKLVEAETRSLGLVVPENHLMGELRNNPAFYGDNGRFSAERFRMVLASNGFTENAYVALLEKDIRANLLIQSLMSGVQATRQAAKLAYLYDNEERAVDVLLFSPELVQDIAEPEAAELERFYQENIEKFRAQEHRVVSLLALDVASLAKEADVEEDELLMEYQSRRDEYLQPERRTVNQLLFADEDTAAAALKSLRDGASIEQAAKQFDAVNSSYSLGKVTSSGVISEAEEAVFSAPKGGFTEPVQSSFGWHIFQITDIEPSQLRPFDEVKAELAAELREQRVGDEVYRMSNTLQDDLAGGASLEEAARSVGTKIQVIGPISREGKSPDGTAVSLPQGYDDLLPQAFGLSEGVVSNLIETDDGSFYALRVDSIIPERTRALDEIRGTVVAGWKEQQREKQLYQLASSASETLSGQSSDAVARRLGATLHSNQRIKRGAEVIADNIRLPVMMLTAVFAAQEGTATEAYALSGGSYAVAKLVAVNKADINTDAGKAAINKAREDLRAVYADELFLQYIAYLRQKHGVGTPNHALIDALLQ